jgi:hypothetical protein
MSMTLCAFISRPTFAQMLSTAIIHFIQSVFAVQLSLAAQNRSLIAFAAFHLMMGLLYSVFAFLQDKQAIQSKVNNGINAVLAASIVSFGILGWAMTFTPQLVINALQLQEPSLSDLHNSMYPFLG